MTISDPRGDRLRTLDAAREAFVEACAGRFEAGRTAALGEVETLDALARAIAKSLASWRPVFQRLDLARVADLEIRRAGALLMESVFDDVIEPDAWRVLLAALDLAEPGA